LAARRRRHSQARTPALQHWRQRSGALSGALSQLARLAGGSYSPTMSTVAEISDAIEKLDVKDQVELLRVLPQHLKISPDDLAWSRLAEPAFEFWNNPEDAIYDQL
jgi:hypothetical protein